MSLPARPRRPARRAGRRARARRADRRLRRDATAPGRRPAGSRRRPGRELERWRGRITDGSWWTRVAEEPGGRIVGLVCFTQAVLERGGRDAHPGAAAGPRARLGRLHAPGPLAAGDRARRCSRTRRTRCGRPATRRSSSGPPSRRPRGGSTRPRAGAHDGRRQWLAEMAHADRGVRQAAREDLPRAPSATPATRSRCSRSARRSSRAATPWRCRPGAAGRQHAIAAGMTFAAAPEYQVFPTRERPLKPYEAAARAARETVPVGRGVRARPRGLRRPHARARARRGAVRRARGDARPARASLVGARLPALRDRRAAAADAARALGLAAVRPARREGARPGPRRVQRLPRAARARRRCPASTPASRGC